ncbi:MAG: hypothetical protein Fur0046_29700 [Cyanobacteria bacterium J069]
MGGTYKTVGINLKGMPLGESDRLLTVLTREHGLIRVVAPGSRKHESTLRGRSGLFAVNQLLIAKGRNLDKIIQAEGVEAFTGLSQDLGKLTAGQYLAELALYQALSHQPQDELFTQLSDALRRIEQLPASATLPSLVQAVYQLLGLAGVAPQVHDCCVTQQPLTIPAAGQADDQWRAGFHAGAGGVVSWEEWMQMEPEAAESGNSQDNSLAATATLTENRDSPKSVSRFTTTPRPIKNLKKADAAASTVQPATQVGGGGPGRASLAEAGGRYAIARRDHSRNSRNTGSRLGTPISMVELEVLQHLGDPDLIQADGSLASVFRASLDASDGVWIRVERLLRHYAQYHFDRQIQSAALIETCFAAVPSLSRSPKHDATD